MIKITVPAQHIRAGGALYERAIEINMAYNFKKEIIKGFEVYDKLPDSMDITLMDIIGVVQLGGEAIGVPTYIKVTDKTAEIPEGLPNREIIDTDEEGNQTIRIKTYGDLETEDQKFTEIEGSFYIGTETFNNSIDYLKGTELYILYTNGIDILKLDEYNALTPEVVEL